jgi:hypothetical protein
MSVFTYCSNIRLDVVRDRRPSAKIWTGTLHNESSNGTRRGSASAVFISRHSLISITASKPLGPSPKLLHAAQTHPTSGAGPMPHAHPAAEKSRERLAILAARGTREPQLPASGRATTTCVPTTSQAVLCWSYRGRVPCPILVDSSTSSGHHNSCLQVWKAQQEPSISCPLFRPAVNWNQLLLLVTFWVVCRGVKA